MRSEKIKVNNGWLTPIEHALKLKEIGYDKPCLFYSEGDESSIELNKLYLKIVVVCV